MTEKANGAAAPAGLEEIQQGWRELLARVNQLEAQQKALEQDNHALRRLLETFAAHRQKSHTELVLLVTDLVSKLPVHDVGAILAKLVEHNTNVSQFQAGLAKGAAEVDLNQPALLKKLDQTKHDLAAALKPVVDELLHLEAPFEPELLRAVLAQPELFFSPRMVRANRCFIKGQVPRERIVREYGPEALPLFNDMTTDAKLNPRPKPDEIALGFKEDFEALCQQSNALPLAKKQELASLCQKVQRSKAATEPAQAQRSAFQRLSFLVELLHYYEHQNVEAPDVVFAQHLPSLLEQLALPGTQDALEEKLIILAEGLLAFVMSADHRLMIINNLGKGGGAAKTLKYVLRLREAKVPDAEELVPEFVRHLIPAPPQKPPAPPQAAAILRLIHPEMQRWVIKSIMSCDRLRKEEAIALGRAIAADMGLKELLELKAAAGLPVEVERQQAWAKIKDLIMRRTDAGTIAAAIRERLNAKYDADEIRQSWITLIDAEPMALIRIFCQIPYLPNGKTDSIAQPVIATYVSRLTHEKYAATYHKVLNSLRSMFKAKPDSPTLLTFLALVKWVNPEAAQKLSTDMGMQG